MNISAVVLTKNSALHLDKTLESLGFCREIVVVDDYSDDGTVASARRFGATVVRRRLGNDFAAQRNFGMKQTLHDWVLFVDSDEIVPPPLRKEITAVTEAPHADGYFISRTDRMWGKALRYGETSRVRLLRLGRKSKGTWHRPVHEFWDITGKTGTLSNPLIHNSHPDIASFVRDVNEYSTINAGYMFDRGASPSLGNVVLYPLAKFVYNYAVLQGFRDGMPGMIVAVMMSLHSFLTRAKLWHLGYTRGK